MANYSEYERTEEEFNLNQYESCIDIPEQLNLKISIFYRILGSLSFCFVLYPDFHPDILPIFIAYIHLRQVKRKMIELTH